MKKKVFIFGHGSGINRGCEAIIRTVSELIKAYSADTDICVCAVEDEYDKKIGYDSIDRFVKYPRFKRKSLMWVLNKLDEQYISEGKLTLRLKYGYIINEIKNSDLCISVGGDNYCYGHPYRYYAIDSFVKKFGKPLVMYGTSIEPTMMKGRKKNDLLRFDKIITRESITYEALNEFMPKGSVSLYPDPAFTLKCKECDAFEGWGDNVVGLNISPLITKYETTPGMVMRSVRMLADKILDDGYKLALIPHVTQPGNSDYDTLSEVYSWYNGNENVFLLPENLTAEQYKYHISNCRMFIGARTHSTIAAYSTCVPTMVLGYSVKSKGIDKDIYKGKYNLLLPVQELNDSSSLLKMYGELNDKHKEIAQYLCEIMAKYKENAFHSVDELKCYI